MVCKYFPGEKIPGTKGFCNLAKKGMARTNGLMSKFRFQIRGRFLMVKLIDHWNKIPKKDM